MKFATTIFTVLATISMVSFQTNAISAEVAALYAAVCETNTLKDATDTNTVIADASPMQFLTGFALGTQVEPKNTGSTCFTQALQTKELLDTFF